MSEQLGNRPWILVIVHCETKTDFDVRQTPPFLIHRVIEILCKGLDLIWGEGGGQHRQCISSLAGIGAGCSLLDGPMWAMGTRLLGPG